MLLDHLGVKSLTSIGHPEITILVHFVLRLNDAKRKSVETVKTTRGNSEPKVNYFRVVLTGNVLVPPSRNVRE
jgi:hypothetical protein